MSRASQMRHGTSHAACAYFAKALARARRRNHPPPLYSVCLGCGCTERDCRKCVEVTGAPCWWIAPNLCSACRDARGIDAAKLAALVDATVPSRLQVSVGIGGAA